MNILGTNILQKYNDTNAIIFFFCFCYYRTSCLVRVKTAYFMQVHASRKHYHLAEILICVKCPLSLHQLDYQKFLASLLTLKLVMMMKRKNIVCQSTEAILVLKGS